MTTGPIPTIPPLPISPMPALVLKDVLVLKTDALPQETEINTPTIGHSHHTLIDPAHNKPDLSQIPGNRMYLGQLELGHVPLVGPTMVPLRGHHPLAGPANSLDPLAGIDNNNNNVEM